MALTYPLPTITAGEYVDQADWNALADSINFLANPPACRVYHNTTQSISNNNATALVFNSERYDTDGMHSTSVNTGRITINTAGVYVVTAHIEIAGDTDYTELQMYIREGGTTTLAFTRELNPGTNPNSRFLNLDTQHKFAAANWLEVVVFQTNTSAGAANVQSISARSPEFAATWVGKGT